MAPRLLIRRHTVARSLVGSGGTRYISSSQPSFSVTFVLSPILRRQRERASPYPHRLRCLRRRGHRGGDGRARRRADSLVAIHLAGGRFGLGCAGRRRRGSRADDYAAAARRAAGGGGGAAADLRAAVAA